MCYKHISVPKKNQDFEIIFPNLHGRNMIFMHTLSFIQLSSIIAIQVAIFICLHQPYDYYPHLNGKIPMSPEVRTIFVFLDRHKGIWGSEHLPFGEGDQT